MMEKNDELKLMSNTPIIDERYRSYADVLEEKVCEEGVNNIGIIAPYGAGKSSLIKTYKETYNIKNSVTVSLANFTSVEQEEKSSSNNNVKDYEHGQVERSILEQLLFSVRKKDVPESKLNRIDSYSLIKSILFAVALVACVVFVTLAVLEKMVQLPESDGRLFYLFFTLSIVALIGLVLLIFRSYSVKKISIKDIDAEFGENKGSILNKFIDEIIYYFHATKTSIVIIEDLDRFNDTKIFSKLREINFLINNSRSVKQKVTFIYAIKDDLFKTDVERAKFFDFVISLLPLLNPENAKDKLKDFVNDENSLVSLPEDYISEVSYFITEMRVLKNIINDYITYYKALNVYEFISNNKNVKLFSLMVYKNLFPNDFADLQFGKGFLNEYFLKKDEKIKEKIRETDAEIQRIDDLLKSANEEEIKNFKYLQYLVAGIIAEKGSIGYRYGNSVYNLSTFVGQNILTVLGVNGYTCQMSVEDIETELGRSFAEIEANIKNKSAERQNELKSERAELVEKNRKLENITLQEYLDEYDDLEIDNETTRFLLSNGYIAEDYMDYIAEYGQEIISENDRLFIRSVLRKNGLNYNYHIEKPEIVIAQIKESRFSDKYILNNDIVSYLLKTENSKLIYRKDKLTEYLCSADEVAVNYGVKYISENDRGIELFCNCIVKKSPILFEAIISSLVTDDKKINVLSNLVKASTDEDVLRFNSQNYLTNYLNNLENPVANFSSVSLHVFERILCVFNIKFEFIGCENSSGSKLVGKILEHNAYQSNISNVRFILFDYLKMNKVKYENKIFTAILNVTDENVKQYMIDNVSCIVKEIIKFEKEISDENDTISYILRSECIENEIKKEYIRMLSVKFDVFPEMDEKLCLFAVEDDKIKYSWENVSLCVNELNIKTVELSEFLLKGADELSKQDVDDEKLILNICNDINYSDSIETIKTLAKSFKINVTVDQIQEDNVAVVLIDAGIIISNKSNLQLCCNNRVKPFCALLCKNITWLNGFEGFSLKNSFIDEIIMSEYCDPLIGDMLSIMDTYLPDCEDAKIKIKDYIINNRVENISESLLEYMIDANISEDDKYKIMENSSSSVPSSKCIQILQKIDTGNQCFEIPVGNSKTLKNIGIDNRALQILMSNGLYVAKQNINSVRIKRVK